MNVGSTHGAGHGFHGFAHKLRPLRIGIALALLGILFGFSLGIAFGAFEDDIKEGLAVNDETVKADVYHGDEAKMSQVSAKAWSYMKRAHMHGGGIGAAALAMLMVLAFIPVKKLVKQVVAVMLGFGSLGYPVFWMLAGFAAPGLGSTGAAKESLAWLALPSSGALYIGTLAMFLLFLYAAFIKRPPDADGADGAAS